jgi:hypothetical protein
MLVEHLVDKWECKKDCYEVDWKEKLMVSKSVAYWVAKMVEPLET